ncbi:hypothetical protein XENOCAPTIV_013413 [Xenoophorus captivus]|uniref:Uncharacterized protein n=1 Tax=Xenoophorus captivus TaxID=1517983 RepID=A0ABV0RSR6_9TELE
MGPYIFSLKPADVDSSPKEAVSWPADNAKEKLENLDYQLSVLTIAASTGSLYVLFQLCGFFLSGQFKSNMTTKMNPSLGRKFLQRIQECSKVSENVDKCVICSFLGKTLKTISKQMRKGQLKVMLQGVKLVQKLAGPLLRSVSLKNLEKANITSLDQIENKTWSLPQVFGPVPSMTESIIVRLGCITQSFSNSELEMLPLSLENLDEIAACGWKNSQVNCRYRSTRLRLVLSVVQLEALGPDNAAMVTSEQRAVLTEEQLSILKKATNGGQEDQKQTQALASGKKKVVSEKCLHVDHISFFCPGAPVSSLEGMSTFVKPVLFLFIGFLLL